ncbi:BppU family phage baseplate upper protein [Latilactobacillus sakei]
MQTMNFNVGTDHRGLVADVQNFKIGNDAKNWVQARQFEGEMRTVVVNVMEGTIPLNLTGTTIWFEGLMSDGKTRIIDAKHGTILSPSTGQFRFEFPYAAFATFGSYKQSFFKIVRDGKSIATLEFTLDVLVNLVEDGLVPLDYITPFQDLYAKLDDIYQNADSDIQVMVTKWQQQITELITGLNADYASIQTTVNGLNEKLDVLSEKIKDSGLITTVEVNQLLEPFNEIIDSFNTYNGLGNPWLDDVNQSIISGLNNYTSTINSKENVVRILNLQDMHMTRSKEANPAYVKGGNAVIKQMHALSIVKDQVDLVVSNGDNIDGSESKALNMHRNQQYVDTIHGVIDKKPLLLTIGNHDDGSVFADGDDVITLKDLTKIYSYSHYASGEHRPDDKSSYAYYDFNDARLRVISLSGFENPEVYNEDGTIKYKRATASVFTSKQLNWLVQALTLDKSWSVIIFNHAPYEGFYENSPYNYMENINHNVLKDILTGFTNGTKITSVGSNSDYPVNITADFTIQGKGTLITNVFGHEHRDADRVEINNIPAIERTCDIALTGDRIVGTVSEFAFDVIEIDTAKHTIKFNRFGSGSNVSWNY